MIEPSDEIIERARKCVSRIVEVIERRRGYAQEIRDGKRDDEFSVEIRETARALMEATDEAEARGRAKGMEEAAKVAEDMMIDAMGPYSVQEAIATTIRAKAQTKISPPPVKEAGQSVGDT